MATEGKSKNDRGGTKAMTVNGRKLETKQLNREDISDSVYKNECVCIANTRLYTYPTIAPGNIVVRICGVRARVALPGIGEHVPRFPRLR